MRKTKQDETQRGEALLSINQIREIEARSETPLFESPSIRLTATERDALCATVRHLLSENEKLKSDLKAAQSLDTLTDRHLKVDVHDAIERLK